MRKVKRLKNTKLFLPLLMLVTLLILGTTTTASSSPSEGEDEPAYVYLTYASPDPAHTINVSWRTDENYIGEVHYDIESRGGTLGAYGSSKEGTGGVTTSEFDGYIHHVELTGLDPDTTYYFICGNPDKGWSEELSFKTAPVERKDIRFVVGGDSRSGSSWPGPRDSISQLMASYNPDFVVSSGDFLYNGETQSGGDTRDTWDNWLGAVYKYWRTEDGRLIPMIPVIGNHELVYPQPSDYDPEEDASNYYMLFNLPGNERWYSLNWGPDLHLIILDSEIRYTGSDSWTEQVDWLGQDLLESRDNLWKIVTTHRPAFSSGKHGSERHIQEDWVPKFDLHHVDLYFNGHDHDYERTHPINLLLSEDNYQPSPENGTIYVTSGGWGAPLYGGYSPEWWAAYGPDATYHFALIDVYENGMLHMRTINRDGEVIDSLTIQKAVPIQPEEEGELPIIPLAAAVVVVVGVIATFLYLRR